MAMARYVPLSRKQHMSKTWTPPDTYAFAAAETVVPAVGLELGMVAASMPMGFVKRGEKFQLVALLSRTAGTNLFIGPDGRWVAGDYVPAHFRCYPFKALQRTGESPGTEPKLTVCVDEASGAIGDDPGGKALFEADGTPAQSVREMVTFLTALERSQQVTQLATDALAEAALLAPWPLKAAKGVAPIGGVYRIDESLLAALDDAAFLKLRKAGALAVAYAQLLSMPRLERLAQLEVVRRNLPTGSRTLLDILSGTDNDTLQF